MLASIFNDVIGPVMRGPSSSHSAAAVRLGLLCRDLCEGTPDRVIVDFDTQGSLATTHRSQGSDMGLFGGLLGWEADDDRLPGSPAAIAEAGVDVEIRTSRLDDPHPNTYRLHLRRGADEHELVGLSTGGGMIEIVEIDGHAVSLSGDYAVTLLWTSGDAVILATELEATGLYDEVTVSGEDLVVVSGQKPMDAAAVDELQAVERVRRLRCVLPVMSRRGMTVPFSHAGELASSSGDLSGPLSDRAIEYERARGGIGEDEVLATARRMLEIMRRGVETGLAGTRYDDRILGWQSGRFAEMAEAGRLLDGGLLNRMIAYVTALMEAKSAMEVIVAAPTAGSCATFPGALLAAVDELGVSGEAAERALLTGGLVGVFVTNRSSFAAEVGGCQAETGAGAAMAAAALVELAGGTAEQSLSAASQSLQNVLGLICDPVANRVEAPCLGRNVSGAANALSCANMALAGYDHLIPLDEVLDAHRQVSQMMARELRCTGLGGLATTPTAQRIELGLRAD